MESVQNVQFKIKHKATVNVQNDDNIKKKKKKKKPVQAKRYVMTKLFLLFKTCTQMWPVKKNDVI